MAFADNLRRLRIERFLSQRELARQAGLHAITLVRLEAGGTAPSRCEGMRPAAVWFGSDSSGPRSVRARPKSVTLTIGTPDGSGNPVGGGTRNRFAGFTSR